MTTLSLHDIGLGRSLLKAVERKARRHGKTASEYVRHLIERDLLADKAFDEILKPVRDDIRHSGITEDQLDQIVTRARKETRRKAPRARR